MESADHEPCVSEVSSTISRLRLHNSSNVREPSDDKESSYSTVVSDTDGSRLRPFTIPSPGSDISRPQIPIIGYEVMEERARFTVYKLRIENKNFGDCWFVFRRYTDFVRLHSKLKKDFPSKNLTLPRKKWFGDNFNSSFLEDRIKGLQSFINSILDYPPMCTNQWVREFFCLDEPPLLADASEESRPIFDALEETIDHLRCQLREKEWELKQMQKKFDSIIHLRNSPKFCDKCRHEIQKCLLACEQDSISVKSSSTLDC